MSTTNSFDYEPNSSHRRTGFRAEIKSQDRRRLLNEDLVGALMMLATILFGIKVR